MRRFLAVVYVLLLAASACRKHSSKEYYRAESKYSVLLAKSGDAAYVDAEMDTVLATLREVNAETVEYPKAVELIAKIGQERARLLAAPRTIEDGEAVAGAVPPPFRAAPTFGSSLPPAPTPEGAVVDGGKAPPTPYQGMSEAEFVKLFIDCMDRIDSMTAPGAKAPGATFQVRAKLECEKQFAVPAEAKKFFIFDQGKLAAEATQQLVRQVTREDAGQVIVNIEVDAGEMLFIPGAPMPPGFGTQVGPNGLVPVPPPAPGSIPGGPLNQ